MILFSDILSADKKIIGTRTNNKKFGKKSMILLPEVLSVTGKSMHKCSDYRDFTYPCNDALNSTNLAIYDIFSLFPTYER